MRSRFRPGPLWMMSGPRLTPIQSAFVRWITGGAGGALHRRTQYRAFTAGWLAASRRKRTKTGAAEKGA